MAAGNCCLNTSRPWRVSAADVTTSPPPAITQATYSVCICAGVTPSRIILLLFSLSFGNLSQELICCKVLGLVLCIVVFMDLNLCGSALAWHLSSPILSRPSQNALLQLS